MLSGFEIFNFFVSDHLNSVESSGGKVFEKFGSMKPIVREVCADSSDSNKLGFWNGF